VSTANWYTDNTTACGGCHGDWSNGWNTPGVDHRTTSGTQSTHGDGGTNYECYECHGLEDASYTFTFDSNDWGGSSKHGNAMIEVNSQGNYDNTGVPGGNLCKACHTTEDQHQFVDTGWMVDNTLAGPTITAGGTPGADCKNCHNASITGAATFRNIQADFDKTAQHAGTWSAINSRDCEVCHYAQHSGYPKLWINATVNHPTSPEEDTHYFVYQRDNTVKARVNELCLSCHDGNAYNSLPNNSGATDWQTATKFTTGGSVPIPDVGPRWNAGGTTKYSKYAPATYNVVPQIDKAFSPHRLPLTNKTKPDFVGTTEAHGYVDGTSYTVNTVGCLECHPAHGSNLVSGHGGDYSGSGLGKSGYMLTAENSKNESGNIHDPSDNPGSGSTAAYADEEELCWGCHVRGWDYRGDDTGTTRTRWQGSWQGDITWVSVKNGVFMSSHFYPNRSALNNWTSGAPTGITRTNLACSTCHDPHGIKPTDNNAEYMVPALRGTWLTSPYKEDRPPSPGDYQNSDEGSDWREAGPSSYGPTAGLTSYWNKGARLVPDLEDNNPNAPGFGYSTNKTASIGDGYFIDENTFGVPAPSSSQTGGGGWRPASGYPSAQGWGTWDGPTNQGDTTVPNPPSKWWIRPKHFDGTLGYDVAASGGIGTTGGATPTDPPTGTFDENVFAGLCMKCHPRSVISDNTNAVYQGHVAVAGWHDDGNATKMMVDDTNRPYMHMQQRVGINNYDAVDGRWGDLDNPPWTWAHDGPAGYRWGVDPGWIGTPVNNDRAPTDKANVQGGYHRFPCSKCHTPHASRLRRMMVTNCLDIGNDPDTIKNTSYAYPQVQPIPSDCGSKNPPQNCVDEFNAFGTLFGLPPGYSTTNKWQYSVTCHADRDGKPSRSTDINQQWYQNAPGTSGWNDVTPW
jgi:hypothetical protein